MTIQIQPERCQKLDTDQAVSGFQSLDGIYDVVIQHGNDDGEYINVLFKTDTPSIVWKEIQRKLITPNPLIADSTIITCEGDDGWNDYLLLHHFDPTEMTDKI